MVRKMNLIALHYNIRKKLRKDNLGTLYEIEDIWTKKISSIKIFDKISLSEIQEKLTPEIMYEITNLSHKNLIKVFDYGIYKNQLFSIIENFAGKNLHNFRLTKKSKEEFFQIIIQICYALQHLHSNKIIHKNLNSENIFYTNKKSKIQLKISDFGYNKRISHKYIGDIYSSEESQILPYFAPEILQGKSFSEQSDFYAFGVLLYYLVTGTFPFTKEEMGQIVEEKATQIIPQFPSILNPEVDKNLEDLIFKLMEFNPKLRFQNVTEIIHQINRISQENFSLFFEEKLANKIQSKSLMPTKKLSEYLENYVEQTVLGKGNIAFLIGDNGIGKKESMQYFRLQLLSEKFHIFNYNCDKFHQDPFFLLCKEICLSCSQQEKLKLKNITSKKFTEFVFGSEEKALRIPENESEMQQDFTFVKDYIFQFSKDKPLIYFISDIDFLKKSTLDFLKFISKDIKNYQILIVISTNNTKLANSFKDAVQIHLQTLTKLETFEYIKYLFEDECPREFSEKIYEFSGGNQIIIKSLLISMFKKNLLKDKNGEWDFEIDFEELSLISPIKNFINNKLKNIPTKIYDNLLKLSIFRIPLFPEIIKYILDFDSSKKLFFFLEECEEFRMLKKDKSCSEKRSYEFYYSSMKKMLFSKNSIEVKRKISDKIIKFFKENESKILASVDDLISQSQLANDAEFIIECHIIKAFHNYEKKNFVVAFNESFFVLKRLIKTNNYDEESVKRYLILLMKTGLIIGKYKSVIQIVKLWHKKLKSEFQIELLFGKLLIKNRNFDDSKKILQNANKLASKSELNDVKIAFLENYILSNQYEKAISEIKKINKNSFTSEQKIEFFLQYANLNYSQKNYENGIDNLKICEKIAKENSYFFQLCEIYKVRADILNMQNKVENAIRFYKKALKICKKEKNLLTLANVLSHWGFLLFKRGELQSGIEKFKLSLRYFKQLDFLLGISEVNLNLAQTIYKLGDFQHSQQHFNDALKFAKKLKNEKLVSKIQNKYSFLKLKFTSPADFLQFFEKNYPEFFQKGTISEINSYLKNYVLFLREIGNENGIQKILSEIKKQKVDIKFEKEFILQSQGWIKRSKENFTGAISTFKNARTIAKSNQNDYAIMIHNINLAETYLVKDDIKQAEIFYAQASSIANKNGFYRWKNYLKLLYAKIALKNPNIKLRIILKYLLQSEDIARKMQDWSVLCQSQFHIMIVYRMLHLKKFEQEYKKKYQNKILSLEKGLSAENKKFLKNKFNFYFEGSRNELKKFYVQKTFISSSKLQHYFFDLLQLSKEDQIKFSIKKYIEEILGIEKIAIILADFSQNIDNKNFWINSKLEKIFQDDKYLSHFEKAISEQDIQYYQSKNINFCIAPFLVKQELVGVIILADSGEFPFTKAEKLIIKLSSFYLTTILKKIGEYQEILKQSEQFSKLLAISRDMLQIMDLGELKNRIVMNALHLTNAERGFFITLDENKNFVFDTALLNSGEKINRDNLRIEKDVLKLVYEKNQIISTISSHNKNDSKFEEYSIYSAPFNVNNFTYGFLYLDNFNGETRIIKIKKKLLEIFLLTAETAIKNSLDYQKLYRANEKLLKIDQERADFINISSHEFNTPIQTIKGYLDILKDETISQDEKKETLKIMRYNINRLSHAINNVMQMNVLESSKTKIQKEILKVEQILQIVYDELKVFCAKRKQKFILEIEENLKLVFAERNSLINAIKNLVLNAIKYTEDYGQIVLGARKSEFKDEKIENEETIVIYVKDNGIGIPSYELDNIFKEFYEVADIKAHHSGLTEFKSSGLGLGLPVTKSIVKLFGGKIMVESVKNEGSTFFIVLPVMKEKKAK